MTSERDPTGAPLNCSLNGVDSHCSRLAVGAALRSSCLLRVYCELSNVFSISFSLHSARVPHKILFKICIYVESSSTGGDALDFRAPYRRSEISARGWSPLNLHDLGV